MDRAPLTPDFIEHPWASIESVRLADDTATVRWADGVELACYSLWLAENVEGIGLEPRTREGTLEPGALPPPGSLLTADVDEDGALALRWSDGVTTRTHPGWLRHVADGHHRVDAALPPTTSWTAATLGPEPPSVDGTRILDDEAVFREWARLMVEFGIARVKGGPATTEFVGQLCRRLGPIRGSNFGDVFDVRVAQTPDSTANTGLALGQHTDLPTRETPPGFQFLHCVENTVAGGLSRMADGIAVVAELAANHPDDHEALSTLEWTFLNRSPDAEHRWQGPIIDHGVASGGRPGTLTLRAFYPVRAFPAMEPADVPRAYAALRRFSQVAHDPRFMITYPFEPGDLVGFDNRRILHGRDAFDEGVGSRHLRGCYLDRDDVLSRLRVLTRRAASRPTPASSTQAKGSTP